MAQVLALILLAVTSFSFAEVDSNRVEKVIDQMVKDHTISAEEAQRVKFRLKKMSQDDWKKVQNARVKTGRAPASVGETQLEALQYHQIQEDISKILPAQRN